MRHFMALVNKTKIVFLNKIPKNFIVLIFWICLQPCSRMGETPAWNIHTTYGVYLLPEPTMSARNNLSYWGWTIWNYTCIQDNRENHDNYRNTQETVCKNCQEPGKSRGNYCRKQRDHNGTRGDNSAYLYPRAKVCDRKTTLRSDSD